MLKLAKLHFRIRRQDPSRGATEDEKRRIRQYREAVRAAAQGEQAQSFARLEELGAMVECGPSEMSQRLCDSYVGLVERGDSVIVVSQTRAEVHDINEQIRGRLRSTGLLKGEESSVVSLQQVDLTAAQMRDPRHYATGSVLIFNRDYRGSRRGEQGQFTGFSETGIVLDVDGRVCRVPFSQMNRLTVCHSEMLSLCAGDKLQLKTNGSALDGRKLANGEVVRVASINSTGEILLEDGRALTPGYRQFQRGYAVTSYSSQGKTVDHVLFADSAMRGASNAQQWYVTISRGRKGIQIFTLDKEQLQRAINRTGERELALDLDTSVRSRHVREQMLRGLKRGRELARRLSRLATRGWTASLRKKAPVKLYETSIATRKTNRTVHTNVLAP